jgi:UDP-N-acetylmuramoyl-L-alanyl-D-glutamate--2,6-diaminopimelate ligase
MEAYFAAKASLFTPEYAKRAVVWVDDEYGARLAETTSVPVTRVARGEASDVVNSLHGSTFFWRGHLVNSALAGDYNVDNALMAMAILTTLGASDEEVAASMGSVQGVPGRFDVLHGAGVNVVIDYAHTPKGLDRLLRDVRSLKGPGRLITVFGAGGDRDRAKRPEMGRVASSLSDVVVVTSDNPRSESPEAIIDAVMSGVAPGTDVRRISERRSAIGVALNEARSGDVVVVAGKGHESTITIGDDVVPFNDRDVVQELLRGAGC